MPRVCIVTDTTAQFTHSQFPGQELVVITPFALEREVQKGEIPLLDMPELRLQHPTEKDYELLYHKLSRDYDSILVLTISSELFPLAPQAQKAADKYHHHPEIEVVDTRTTSVGLGWLVEQAARAAQAGEKCSAIARQVREKITSIYFLFFIPNTDGLVNTRHITPSQALVARMLDMLPIFLLEEGRLVPQEKAGSLRMVMEYFEDFMDEYENPARLALVRSAGQPAVRLGQLRQHIRSSHPETHFSEHTFPAELEPILGRESMGMAIMQKDDYENRIGI